jgi:FtsP/CotA-like multicopper oxidase with cupredoxin domain
MTTYGGTYPGPTIKRPSGQLTKITYVNRLPRALGDLTVHLHGDHHASADDGQPDTKLIKPGGKRTYTYALRNGGKPAAAATNFYHDHLMDNTGQNVWNGLQAMFITTDRHERSLPLPKGDYDVPLLIADRAFDVNNQLTQPFQHPGDGTDTTQSKFLGPYAAPGDATVGDRVLVNGVYGPHFNVDTHRYRLRLLNGSNFQSYDFKLSNGRPFVQIGTGSGLLPKPVVRDDIILGPAQRADVIVDFGKDMGKKVTLQSVARTDGSVVGIGTPEVPIMQFRVKHRVSDHTRIPSRLQKLPKLNAPAVPDMVWTFGLGGDLEGGMQWTVNGHPYDPTRIDHQVEVGDTQTWLLQNVSPITHYIHLHEEAWQTLTRDGQPAEPYEAIEDTWRLDPGESVTVAAKFTDFTGPFMIHCHMLDHEDHGMMAQFAVVKKGSTTLPAGYHFGASTSPTLMHGGMDAAAVAAMGRLGSHHESADAPAWAGYVVRGAWAASVELPLLGLLLLWRRRRTVAGVAARATGIVLLGGIAATHAADLLHKLVEAPYLGAAFLLLIAGCGAAAVTLATVRNAIRVERLAAGLAALTAVGYVVSRTVGLPQIADHVGHWADPWGTAALITETAFVVLAARHRVAALRLPRIALPALRGAPMTRPRWVVALGTAVAVLTSLIAGVPSEAGPRKPHVLLVCKTKCPKADGVKYYKSLQLAVDHAVNGDWILVWPGKYNETTEVKPNRALTSGLHIRGMNRNSVVFDGKGTAGSGVWVNGVNNTWIENMTGQNFKGGSANAFYWTSVDGWWGNYLTAYNNGDYGVYAFDSTSSGKTPAAFAHIYASWNADSGIYVGGCRDCNAVVTQSVAEKNALGYSGTNAGGELYLINNEWAHNATGILPNTLTSEPDAPQEGVYIVNNWVHDNNDHDVPGAGITGIAPVGVGIGIAGGWNNIIRGNLIEHQKHQGVSVFWLFTPPVGNQIIGNVFRKVGTGGMPDDVDIALDGTSLQTCLIDNVRKAGGRTVAATTDPPGIGELNNCGSDNPARALPVRPIYQPGDPLHSILTALNAVGITEPKEYKGPGPAPGAKGTMPNPCKGVPDNPWCEDGHPTLRIPKAL